MTESLRDVAKVFYEVENSVSCKICVKCKETKGNEHLSCVDCIEEGLTKMFDKQTPKKPKIRYKATKFDRFLGQQDAYVCPTCSNACLVRYAPNLRNENRYCYDCGQAIDWSDE